MNKKHDTSDEQKVWHLWWTKSMTLLMNKMYDTSDEQEVWHFWWTRSMTLLMNTMYDASDEQSTCLKKRRWIHTIGE
jgi:hypothetical protein